MQVGSVVAVVDVHKSTPVVWWVDLGRGNDGLSRLGGAWVLDTAVLQDQLPHLLAGRLVVTTAAGRTLLEQQHCPVVGHVDVAALHAAIVAERDRLQLANEDTVAKPGKANLVAPAWSALPEPMEVDTASTQSGDPVAARALAIAQHLLRLCNAWERIEEQRLARGYMRQHGGPQQRPLPITKTIRSLVVAEQPRPHTAAGAEPA